MNGNIAIGSRRTTPTSPVAAAVVSDDKVAPRKIPCCQSRDSVTSGTVVFRRPPKRIAEIGTPFGSSHSGAMIGHCPAGVQKRELGCELGSSAEGSLRPEPSSPVGVQSRPLQSVRWAGGSLVIPSHQMSPSSVSATLVKIELPRAIVRIALALVCQPVPGATPKNPYSGLSA